MAQWVRVCLPMQVTQVPSLIRENPTCCRATNPCVTTAEAHVLRAHAPQQEKPPEWGASVPQREQARLAATRQSPRAVMEIQHSQKQINKIKILKMKINIKSTYIKI